MLFSITIIDVVVVGHNAVDMQVLRKPMSTISGPRRNRNQLQSPLGYVMIPIITWVRDNCLFLYRPPSIHLQCVFAVIESAAAADCISWYSMVAAYCKMIKAWSADDSKNRCRRTLFVLSSSHLFSSACQSLIITSQLYSDLCLLLE